MSASIKVKCVICGHKDTVALVDGMEAPWCAKCYGPVVVEAAEVKLPRKRQPATQGVNDG